MVTMKLPDILRICRDPEDGKYVDVGVAGGGGGSLRFTFYHCEGTVIDL